MASSHLVSGGMPQAPDSAVFHDTMNYEMDLSDGEGDDSEGGVPLPTALEPHHSRDPHTTLDLEMIIKYHQTTIDPSSTLAVAWQLPAKVLDLGPRQLHKNRCNFHPIEFHYNKLCKLIRKHWDRAQAEWIPAELQGNTPYSMAMLAELRRLSTRTKRDLPMAHRLMLEASQNRVAESQSGNAHDIMFDTDIVRPRAKGLASSVESRIREDARGLVVDDVRQAYRVACTSNPWLAKKEKKRSAKAERVAQRKAMSVIGTSPTDSSKSQRSKGLKWDLRPLTSVSNIGSAGGAGTAVLPGFTRGDELVGIQTFGESLTTNAEGGIYAPPNFRAVATGHNDDLPRSAADPNAQSEKENKREAANLSSNFDRINIGNDKRVPKKARKLRILERGGLSRGGNQPRAMPMEKIDFNSVSTLNGMASVTDDEEALAKLGQLPLPPPATDPSSSAGWYESALAVRIR